MTKPSFSLLGDNSFDQGRAFFTKKKPACSSTTRTLPLLGAVRSNRWVLEGHLFNLLVSPDVISGTILKNRPKNERTMSPLALPDLEHLSNIEKLLNTASVALFVQRVQAIKHDFQLTVANANVIADICTR